MARLTAQLVETIPYGPLGIIAMPGCEALAEGANSAGQLFCGNAAPPKGGSSQLGH